MEVVMVFKKKIFIRFFVIKKNNFQMINSQFIINLTRPHKPIGKNCGKMEIFRKYLWVHELFLLNNQNRWFAFRLWKVPNKSILRVHEIDLFVVFTGKSLFFQTVKNVRQCSVGVWVSILWKMALKPSHNVSKTSKNKLADKKTKNLRNSYNKTAIHNKCDSYVMRNVGHLQFWVNALWQSTCRFCFFSVSRSWNLEYYFNSITVLMVIYVFRFPYRWHCHLFFSVLAIILKLFELVG